MHEEEPASCMFIQIQRQQTKPFIHLVGRGVAGNFKRLPTSFVLKPEEVDKIRDAARRILSKSEEFQRLMKDLQ
jgi:hypothetical protein